MLKRHDNEPLLRKIYILAILVESRRSLWNICSVKRQLLDPPLEMIESNDRVLAGITIWSYQGKKPQHIADLVSVPLSVNVRDSCYTQEA